MRRLLLYSLALAPLVFMGCLPSDAHGGGAAGTGSGSGGGTGTGGNTIDPGKCGVQNFMLAKGGTPDLLIVQDISGSMGQTEDDQTASAGTPSKWTEISAAIESVVGQINSVDWGLMMFPAKGSGKQCAPTTADVAVGASTAAAISAKLMATTPNGTTPTADTINSAVAYLQGVSDGNTKYIVLATDGEPNSCGGNGDDSANAEKAVADAAAAGISTFVVGIGTTGGAQATLNKMAIAGKQAQAGAVSYYPVTSQAALETVLQNVTGQIVSCSYPLTQAPANPDLVGIEEDGATIPRDTTHTNGWDFGPGDLSINFYGAACANLQNGSVSNVGAVYGCPPIS
jgi:hypothetical protein